MELLVLTKHIVLLPQTDDLSVCKSVKVVTNLLTIILFEINNLFIILKTSKKYHNAE
jgi:hypothetical protein